MRLKRPFAPEPEPAARLRCDTCDDRVLSYKQPCEIDRYNPSIATALGLWRTARMPSCAGWFAPA